MHDFKEWSESLLNIKEDKTIHAVYEGKAELFITLEMSGKLFLSLNKDEYKDDEELKYVAILSAIDRNIVFAINEKGFEFCNNITKIYIPEGIVKIYENAFYGCELLKEVYIPKSVDDIREDAFNMLNNCSKFDVHSDNENYSAVGDALYDKGVTKLISYPRKKEITELEIPNTVTEIMKGAFQHHAYLTTITLPENLQVIGTEAFLGTKITSITIPGTVKEIGYDAFYSCNELETLILEEGVESSDGSFRKCTKLTTVTLPKSFKQFFNVPFDGCSHLEEINVHQDNPNFTSIDGVLYSKDKTILIKYPEGKQGTDFTIPDTVTEILFHSFYNLLILENVIIPLNVTKIKGRAFQSERLSVYARAASKPAGWNDEWCHECLHFEFGYSGE